MFLNILISTLKIFSNLNALQINTKRGKSGDREGVNLLSKGLKQIRNKKLTVHTTILEEQLLEF